MGLFAEYSQGRIVAHSAQGVDALNSHGAQEFAHVLHGIAKSTLTLQQCLGIGHGQFTVKRNIFQLNGMLLQPLAIRMLAGDLVLDFVIANDATLLRIDDQHPTGTETILFHDGGGINVHHTHLGGQHNGVVFCNVVTGGTQAIAVQCGADGAAIGKGHGGGAIPGFNKGVVVFKEGLQIRVQMGIFTPGLRNHHHHSMGQATTAHYQKLQAVIKHAGVGAGFVDNRHNLANIIAPQTIAAHGLASTHPVDVTTQGVDFAIMHQITIGMSALPAGEGIGAETGMDQSQRRFHGAILHIHIEGTQLFGGQHALVDNGAGGQAGNIKILATPKLAVTNVVFGLTTDAVELALKGIIINVQTV